MIISFVLKVIKRSRVCLSAVGFFPSPAGRFLQMSRQSVVPPLLEQQKNILTSSLLSAVASDGTYDCIFVPAEAVGSALNVAFCLSCIVFRLALCVFFLSRCLHRLGTENIASRQRRRLVIR